MKTVRVITSDFYFSFKPERHVVKVLSQVHNSPYFPRVYKLIVTYPYLCCHNILTCGYIIICLITRHFISPVGLFKWFH